MKSKSPALSGQLADADIRTLRIFKSVVESHGFSPAAVTLNITRSAVSLAMADLEQRLSLRLCERGRGGFSLTNEGREVYKLVLQLLAALDEFRSQVNAIHFHLKGELNIGITDNLVTMPQMRVTHALRGLNKLAPDVQVNIQMIPPNEIESKVLDGQLHVGVIPVRSANAGLNYLNLYDERSSLFCSKEHELFHRDDSTVSVNTIKQQDAVVPTYQQSSEVKPKYDELKLSATATDREGVAFLILTGRYIGYLPDHYAQRWVNEGAMRALLPMAKNYVTHFAIITKKSTSPNSVLEAYLDQLTKSAVS